MKKIRVLIVDDQYISRQLFEVYIQSSERYELVKAISSAAYAHDYVLSQNIDLVIMDIFMNDGSNGLDAAERIKKKMPNTKIIAVTSMPEYSWMERARDIGVNSFWYKEAPKETILELMDRTMSGESIYPDRPPMTKLGLADMTELTDKELELLKILTTGASNGIIGDKLGISEGTVKQYLNRLFSKTGCRSRTELAVKARVSGIVIDTGDTD